MQFYDLLCMLVHIENLEIAGGVGLIHQLPGQLIRDNYASQKEKGTLDGLVRLKQQMAEYYRRTGSADGWVLKCDVRKFFASIDHDILKAALASY